MPLFTQVRGRGIMRTSRLRSSEKVALRVDLPLDHRLGWLRGGYGVRVSVHHLPGAILRSKDHRGPKRVWGDLLSFAYLGLQVLYLNDVGKFGGYVLGHYLKAGGPAVSAQGGGMLGG